jgi:intron-binding protein aquarius
MLVTGELWPSTRILKEEENKDVPGQTQMEGVEHLGQYVYEMTNAKVQQLRVERGLEGAPPIAIPLTASDETLNTVHENFQEGHSDGTGDEDEK